MRVYTARWVLPVAGRPLRDGAIAVVGGRIAAVGVAEAVIAAAGDAEVVALGHAALMPSPVNAHTHVELSWLAADPLPGGDWATWVEALLARRADEDPQTIERAARAAIATMRERGIVGVGDVGNGGRSAPWLAEAGCHGVAFLELYGLRVDDGEAAVTAAAERLGVVAGDPALADGRVRIALTPHAPHTTGAALLRALAGRAIATGDPLSIHAAESRAEVDWLRDGSGPLGELYARRGFAPEGWEPPRATPVERLDRIGVLRPGTLVVHAVHIDHGDVTRLQSRGVTVVTCPRSNRFLGVGDAPVGRMLRAGIPVALGTDSLASSPDLDLFAEMAALREIHPDVPPAAVVRMATRNGAVALGLGERLGTLEAGRLAALVAVPLAEAADDPLAAVCAGPSEVMPLEIAARTFD